MNQVINYFRRWQMGQWVRTGFGLLFIVAFIFDQQWPYILFGSVFLIQAFMNKGCSGDNCSI